MKRFLKCIFITVAMANVALAYNASQSKNDTSGSGFFIGIEGTAARNLSSYTQTTTSSSDIKELPGGTFLTKDWSGSVGLKLGYYINNNNRLYLSYFYDALSQSFKASSRYYYNKDIGNIDKEINAGEYATHRAILGYDYLYNIYGNSNFIVGGYLGYGANIGKVNVSTFNGKKGPLISAPDHFTSLTNSIIAGINIGYLYSLSFTNGYFGDLEVGVKWEYLKTLKASKKILVGVGVKGTYQDTLEGFGENSSTGFYLGYSYKF